MSLNFKINLVLTFDNGVARFYDVSVELDESTNFKFSACYFIYEDHIWTSIDKMYELNKYRKACISQIKMEVE